MINRSIKAIALTLILMLGLVLGSLSPMVQEVRAEETFKITFYFQDLKGNTLDGEWVYRIDDTEHTVKNGSKFHLGAGTHTLQMISCPEQYILDTRVAEFTLDVRDLRIIPKIQEKEPEPSETEPEPSETEPKPSETTPKPSETEPKPSESQPEPSQNKVTVIYYEKDKDGKWVETSRKKYNECDQTTHIDYLIKKSENNLNFVGWKNSNVSPIYNPGASFFVCHDLVFYAVYEDSITPTGSQPLPSAPRPVSPPSTPKPTIKLPPKKIIKIDTSVPPVEIQHDTPVTGDFQHIIYTTGFALAVLGFVGFFLTSRKKQKELS